MTANILQISRNLHAGGFTKEQAETIAESIAEGVHNEASTKSDIAELKGELKTDIAELRAEIRIIKAIGVGIILIMLAQLFAQYFH